ncbi:hypothetical protein PG985_010598 [Apiospora marii]|uniref:Zn(2)-C6 fungal-type domain-containing protein n=1 Tax=Apiospora marii TaxID=335849 RepID=A0ABR1T1F1_9PEZI
MSRNSSITSLVGFSVYQPALGAQLQFVPEMGSKELDDMINAYVPGPASILDKRTAVSLEFFDYTIHTGELFKFFYVYSPISTTGSPASSSMHDSGYGSNFNTSPVMSESQWTQSMPSAPASQTKAQKSSKKAASSVRKPQVTDFSQMPGFSIMTKDGQDVTNSASRGCKTKEQRDHAHLMRIIKACEACRKKKTRCDPSHRKAAKAQSASESNGRASKAKKATTTKSASVASMKAESVMAASSFDSSASGSFTLDQSFASALEPVTDNWDQFIQYDEEYAETVPQDYDFFYDPAGYFSPSTSNTSSQVPSPHNPVTPPTAGTPGHVFVPAEAPTFLQPLARERIIDTTNTDVTDVGLVQTQPLGSRVASVHRDVMGTDAYGTDSGQKPMLPYLAGDAADVGNNYVDFNLYSPASSFLDEDPGLVQDIAASTRDRHQHSNQRSSSGHRLDQNRRTDTLADQLLATDLIAHVGDGTLTDHGDNRIVNNATTTSSRQTRTTATHGGIAMSSSGSAGTAGTLVAHGHNRLASNVATTNMDVIASNAAVVNNAVIATNAAIASNAASANSTATVSNAATTSSRTVPSHSDGNENRVEMLRRTGSLQDQKSSSPAHYDLIAQKPGTASTQDSQANSGTGLDQSQAGLQASQHSQGSSCPVSGQSMAALAICAAIFVVSAILSSYARRSLLWLDHGVQQDQSNNTLAALPLAAIVLKSLQVSSERAPGSKRDMQAQGSSRWETGLSRLVPGALSTWSRMSSSLSSSISGNLQRGILV